MILLYKGTSLLSRTIEWFNWGDYSHAAFRNEKTGEVIEAWAGGVRLVKNEWIQHNNDTHIDYFDFIDPLTDYEAHVIWQALCKEVGKKYDYFGILHFLTRRGGDDRRKWFCSELVFSKVNPVRTLLNNVPDYKVYPSMLAMPTSLWKVASVTGKQRSTDENIAAMGRQLPEDCPSL
ncbi:MAG: hypothetical protein PHD04_02890 [Candidatus Pacebacteria bacterium]|nr:hypothetical protein [Candidatus Paceibacterota bacterium]